MSTIQIETDHKPLVPLMTTKLIGDLPIRIQRFRIRLMRYNLVVRHVAGKDLNTADALSRSPLSVIEDNDSDLRNQAEYYVNTVMVNLPASDKRLEEIRIALRQDETLKLVMHYVEHGWPLRKQEICGPINKYWSECQRTQ